MLVKNEKKLYFDAHFHYFDCIKNNSYIENSQITGCTCAHSREEWENQAKISDKFVLAYGMHPQKAGGYSIKDELDFIERLLQNKQIHAIGEMGFDFFTEEYKSKKEVQIEMWESQLELGLKYKVPVIVHCRKANELLFKYSQQLKNLPGVLFHSFMGNSIEALSLLNRGINGYFSFGKQLMNGNKKVLDCVKNLPFEKLLLETDAPFQTFKNENVTNTDDIILIYNEALKIREIENNNILLKQMSDNFSNLYNLK